MSLGEAAVAAAIAAATAGVVFGLAVILADLIGVERIRPIFLNVTQDLLDFVTFGRPTPSAPRSSS